MKEVFLNFAEVRSYMRANEAMLVGDRVSEVREGRSYKKQIVLCPLSDLSQLIRLIGAIVVTVLTAFLALLSKNVRTLWDEVLNGREYVCLLLSPHPIDYVDRIIFTTIFKGCTIPEMLKLATVCKKFNEILKSPYFWGYVAKEKNIELDLNNPDIKGQVINAEIPLTLGSVNVGKKEIKWKQRADEETTDDLDFFKEAISLFGANHYVAYYAGKESVMYVYCDSDSQIKHVQSNWDNSADEILRIKNTMKWVECDHVFEQRYNPMLAMFLLKPGA